MKTQRHLFSRGELAFTLIELLVSMAIIMMLMLVLVALTDSARRTWTYTTSKVEQFREAREAFESLTRRISQASLNTYWDYLDAGGQPRTAATMDTFVPASYSRQSELRFMSGNATTLLPGINDRNNSGPLKAPTHAVFFQAPLGFVQDANYSGLENLLNTWGYYVELVNDTSVRPLFLKGIKSIPIRTRFRLMEMMEPSEKLTVYATPTTTDWFLTPMEVPAQRQVVAENVIALIILPKLSPADQKAGNYEDYCLAKNYSNSNFDYTYDSTQVNSTDGTLNPHHQLPPLLQITLVAIDELSANRMGDPGSRALLDKLNTLFIDASKLSQDLSRDSTTYPDIASDPSLEAYLIRNRINYHIFSTNVSIKAAKWSRSQKN